VGRSGSESCPLASFDVNNSLEIPGSATDLLIRIKKLYITISQSHIAVIYTLCTQMYCT
jgi:hypothetical protein